MSFDLSLRPAGGDPWQAAHGQPSHAAAHSSGALGSGAIGVAGHASGGAAHATSPIRKIHTLLRGRYILAILLAILGAAAGAYFGFRSQTPVYQSTGLVELRPIIPSLLRDDRLMLNFNSFINNQVAMIQSRRVIEMATNSAEWRSTGLGTSASTTADFQSRLMAEIIPGSTYVRVTFNHPDAAVARAGVVSVIRAYQQVYGEINTGDTQRKIELLEKNRTMLRNQIDLKRQQILDLSSTYATDNLETFHNEKLRQLVQIESEMQRAAHTLATVEGAVNTDPSGIPGVTQAASPASALSERDIAQVDPTLRELMALRAQQAAELQRREASYGINHRLSRAAQNELAIISQQIATLVDDFRSRYVAILIDPATQTPMPVSQDLLRQLRQKVQFLRQQYDTELATTQSIGRRKLDIQAVQNDVERLKGDLDLITNRIEQLSAETLMGGELTVISLGDQPTAPAVDRRKQMAAVGFAGGGALPVALLLLVGLVDARYRYSDDAGDHLPHLPLLGILPQLPDMANDPSQASLAAHCVHQIRTMLQIAADHQNRRVFAITSPSPEDGKTSLCLALGLSFASSGSRTLLIDCDITGGGLSARMNARHPHGTLEAVANRSLGDLVQPTDVDQLKILPLGTDSLVNASVLSPAALTRLVAEAKDQFDTVLIDTGPILGSIEASPACVAADAVVVVVARGRQRAMVQRSLNHLMAIGARLSGIVFNRATSTDFDRSVSRLTRSAPDLALTASHARQSGKAGPVVDAMSVGVGGGAAADDRR